jgi:hypothetical protein
MTPLMLVVLLLVALHHWLVMPFLLASTWLLELKPLPWLLLAALAWLLAARSDPQA